MQEATGLHPYARADNAEAPGEHATHVDVPSVEVLDGDTFQALLSTLQPTVLLEIYRQFLLQTRQRCEALQRSSDSATLHAFAHTLRGTAGMLGATSIAALADQFTTDGAPLLRSIDRLETACHALESALRQERLQV